MVDTSVVVGGVGVAMAMNGIPHHLIESPHQRTIPNLATPRTTSRADAYHSPDLYRIREFPSQVHETHPTKLVHHCPHDSDCQHPKLNKLPTPTVVTQHTVQSYTPKHKSSPNQPQLQDDGHHEASRPRNWPSTLIVTLLTL